MLLPEPPLRQKAQGEVRRDGRVDPDEEVAHVPQDDGQIDVLEEADPGETVSEVEGDGDQEAEEVSDGDPLVFGTNGEHLVGHGPSEGQGVVLLNVLARPDLCGRLVGGGESYTGDM